MFLYMQVQKIIKKIFIFCQLSGYEIFGLLQELFYPYFQYNYSTFY